MENASKALLIAGAVLIGILVASLGVFLSEKISDFTTKTYRELQEHRRTEFNQQFLKYDKRNDLIIQDIVTIINLAKDSNRKNDLDMYNDLNEKDFDDINTILDDGAYYVKVEYFDDTDYLGLGSDKCKTLEKFDENDLNKMIKREMDKSELGTFSCEVYLNNNTQYVSYIIIR